MAQNLYVRPSLYILVGLFCADTTMLAADWPQWRGLHRDGTSPETVAAYWPAEGPRLMWQAPVGAGFSGVSISAERAFTLGNTNSEDTIWCFHAHTGKLLWSRSYPAKLDPQYYEGGPTATPSIAARKLYSISKAGDVLCLDDRDGKVLWRRDLRQEGFKPPRWGYSGSPLLWRDLVILNAGSAGIALKRDSGEMAWKSDTNGAGYASPTLWTNENKELVLLFAAKHLVCVDPVDGRELWRHFWETGWDTNNSDPLTRERQILISSFTRGCALLNVKSGQPEVLYDSKVLYNHLSPGIQVGEFLYAFSGEAKKETDLRCIQVTRGELRWKSNAPEFGSMILAGDRLVILSAKGELIIADPSPEEFKPLARAHVLNGTCWTPPSLANGLLYVRNAKGDLKCFNVSLGTGSRGRHDIRGTAAGTGGSI